MESLELKILGGLPVTIEFDIEPADPSVGLMSACVADWHISEINSKPCKKPPQFLYYRIDAKAGEEERIIDEINKHIVDARYTQYDPDYDY